MAVILEKKDVVGFIRIDNPATLNALSSQVLKELNAQIENACEDVDIHVVVITGTGKSFVAGADISSMSKMNPREAEEFALYGSSIFHKIETSNKVFIAAINGYALGGGCELALACDIRVASEKAKFGLPEVSLGVFPGFSGIRKMMEIVGEAKTKELIFTGKMITARDAENINLVSRVVEPENLEEEVVTIAKSIANNSMNAVAKAKYAINVMSGIVNDIIIKHSKLFGECFAHPDQKEGMTAFLEKRKPNFK